MELKQFMPFAVGVATALSGLHKSELIHKHVKPANVLVNPARGRSGSWGESCDLIQVEIVYAKWLGLTASKPFSFSRVRCSPEGG